MKATAIAFAIVLLSVAAFSTRTDGGLASVISAGGSAGSACINAVNQRDGNTLTKDHYDVETAYINGDREKDIILKNTSDQFCGSAGCVYEICLAEKGSVTLLPFSYAAQTLKVKDTLTDAMHDIELQGQGVVRLTWDNSRYVVRR